MAGRAGGPWLFITVNVALLVASIGSGAGAHLGAGRLLYSMGRDNAIPSKFFGAVNPRTRIPSNNIILIGVIMLIAALTLKAIQEFEHMDAYGFGCTLLNFGALLAFMAVNLAAFVHYFVRGDRTSIWKSVGNFIAPILGFSICAYLWAGLGKWAIIVGLCWLTTGVIYGAWRTAFFTKQFSWLQQNERGLMVPGFVDNGVWPPNFRCALASWWQSRFAGATPLSNVRHRTNQAIPTKASASRYRSFNLHHSTCNGLDKI